MLWVIIIAKTFFSLKIINFWNIIVRNNIYKVLSLIISNYLVNLFFFWIWQKILCKLLCQIIMCNTASLYQLFNSVLYKCFIYPFCCILSYDQKPNKCSYNNDSRRGATDCFQIPLTPIMFPVWDFVVGKFAR